MALKNHSRQFPDLSLQALEVARERRPDLGGKARAGKEREAAKAREEAAVREVLLLLLVLLVLMMVVSTKKVEKRLQ